MRAVSYLVVLLLLTPALRARLDLLLVPPREKVSGEPGLILLLHLNNPTPFADSLGVPRIVEAVCTAGGERRTVALEAVGGTMGLVRVAPATREIIELRLKDPLPRGGRFVSLRLETFEANTVMIDLGEPAPALPAPRPPAPPDLDLSDDLADVRRHISAHEPIYFALGARGGLHARFQVSFKYRFFEESQNHLARQYPELFNPERLWRRVGRDLHVAFTQTSIWDLTSESKPFRDSSYRPAIFLEHAPRNLPRAWRGSSLQYGAQHESNGRAGATSRSLNSLYLAPTFRRSTEDGHFLELRPRASAYFHLDENRDIARFRGYVELGLRGGHDRGWQLAAHLRGHPAGHGSLELNLTLPFSHLPWPTERLPALPNLPAAVGGYLQIQYFNGYGESLLDYNVRRPDQLRFGYTLVR